MTCVTCVCGNTDMWMNVEKDKSGETILRVHCIECNHLVLEAEIDEETVCELLHKEKASTMEKGE